MMAAASAMSGGKPKLHGRAFYQSIGSPKYVVAPMVDQSEFAWRMLSRSFMTAAENPPLLAYTPMFHARLFHENEKYRDTHFQATRPPAPAKAGRSLGQESPPDRTPWKDGNPALDRPLFVQFCANEPDHLLSAAQLVAPYCDAVDLNLGCPQGIAKRGHYGAFLQDDQELVYKLINTLHRHLSIPVTAKIRILQTKEKTLEYAKNVLSAGASIITVHGRVREQKGHLTGVADWTYIRYLRENLPKDTVIFANGNILQPTDVQKCLEATGADAVMSAEGNLSDPGIFGQIPPVGQKTREYWRGRDGKGGYRIDAVFRRYLDVIHKYVLEQEPPTRKPLFLPGEDEAWLQDASVEADAENEEDGPARKKRKKDVFVGEKRERCFDPNLLAVRGHLFHMLRHLVSRYTDIRDALAKCAHGNVAGYERVLDMVERRVASGLTEYEKSGGKSFEEPEPLVSVAKVGEEVDPHWDTESSVATVKRCMRPWWVVQPIVRPLPKEALANGALQLSKKEKERQQKEAQKTENGDKAQDVEKVKKVKKIEKIEKAEKADIKPHVEDDLPNTSVVNALKEPPINIQAPALISAE